LVSPGGVRVSAAALDFDIPVMIGAAVACLPVFYTGTTISRWEGTMFLGYYAAYVTYLVLNTIRHGALATLQFALLWFVIPLTAVTLAFSVWETLQRRRPVA
jgi:cation:H+ antiporter